MLIWSGRRQALSSKGAGDTDNAVTTAAEQSVSPSAATAQSQGAEAPPKRPLEALADQTSASSVVENRLIIWNDEVRSALLDQAEVVDEGRDVILSVHRVGAPLLVRGNCDAHPVHASDHAKPFLGS